MSYVSHSNATKVEKYQFYNNLVCLVKGLEKSYTAIDLHNECSVTGKIISVDGYMNIEMEDVVFYNQRGERAAFQTFFVQGRNIRYVHIPEGNSGVELLEEQLAIMRPNRNKSKPTFKKNRAKKYHQTIVNEIYQQSSSSK